MAERTGKHPDKIQWSIIIGMWGEPGIRWKRRNKVEEREEGGRARIRWKRGNKVEERE